MKYNMRHISLLILLILSVVVFIVYIIISTRKYPPTYYKHPAKILGKIQSNIYKDYNFKESDKWSLYIPRNYNNIERELLTINTSGNKLIFGINGCDSFVSKNGLWSIIVEKYGVEFASKIMPRSYLLYNQDDLSTFKNEYNPDGAYIMKKNIQRKEGLKITTDLNEILNGHKTDGYKVVQQYMNDAFHVNLRKLNIRIYILVIYNIKPRFYIYNLGKCIYTNKDYNGDIHDKESSITSYKMDNSIYDKSPFYTSELDDYIKSLGYSSKKVMTKIKKLMRLVCRPIKNKIFKSRNIRRHTTFQLFGCDIILDQNLNPYILEFNKGPEMTPKNDEDYKLKYKLNMDMYNKVRLVQTKSNHFSLLF